MNGDVREPCASQLERGLSGSMSKHLSCESTLVALTHQETRRSIHLEPCMVSCVKILDKCLAKMSEAHHSENQIVDTVLQDVE